MTLPCGPKTCGLSVAVPLFADPTQPLAFFGLTGLRGAYHFRAAIRTLLQDLARAEAACP